MTYKNLLKYYNACTDYETLKRNKLYKLYRANTALKCPNCGNWVYQANTYNCVKCLEQLSWAFDKEK